MGGRVDPSELREMWRRVELWDRSSGWSYCGLGVVAVVAGGGGKANSKTIISLDSGLSR